MTKDEALKLALGALEVATTPLAKDRQEVLRAITAIKEALAQPEQEPVKDWVASHNAICVLLRQAHDALALTSYPPKRKWVGLTDEELSILGESFTHPDEGIDEVDFGMEIQRILKEKNT